MAELIPVTDTMGDEQPGLVRVAGTDEVVQIKESYIGQLYDTVFQEAGGITAGTDLPLFLNVQNKNLQFNNFQNNAGTIGSRRRIIITNIGLAILQAFGDTVAVDSDMIKAAHAGVLVVKVNETRKIAEGPLFQYPGGWGVVGTTTRTGTGVVTNGVGSVAAAPELLVAQPVGERDALQGTVNFPNVSNFNTAAAMPTLTARLGFQIVLRGVLQRPGLA